MATTQIIDDIIRYYDATVIDFKILWSRSKDLALHYGYYDDGVKKHKDSLLKMNEVLAKLADIVKNDRVLDAGCGYGGSAIWLAKNIGCEVVGITVFPYHVSEAKKYAKKYGVSDRVSFREEDYAHTSFLNDSFSVVWGLESFVHAESRKDLIHEAHRLLKKGGRILISEYMFREDPHLSADEKKIFDPWLIGWVMPSLVPHSEYKSLLSATGFVNIKVHDITENIRLSVRRVEKITNFMVPVANLLMKLKIISAIHRGNFEAAATMAKTFKLGLWRYVVITAEKA